MSDRFEHEPGFESASDDPFRSQRDRLVNELANQIRDRRVLEAVRAVPRHLFIPPQQRAYAYQNRALGIGSGQTISQPTVVALSAEALALKGHERVLEIGTGSGYQCAVLAQLADHVVSVERIPELRDFARGNLRAAGIENVTLALGDGSMGWAEGAPYDAICVTAASPHVPQPLLDQLAEGGRVLVPVGSRDRQTLRVTTKTKSGLRTDDITPVVFVPLIGEEGWKG